MRTIISVETTKPKLTRSNLQRFGISGPDNEAMTILTKFVTGNDFFDRIYDGVMTFWTQFATGRGGSF